MGIEIAPRERCPECAANGLDTAGDNLAIYEDGKFCQSCTYVEKKTAKFKRDLIPGSIVELADRGLTYATCEKYNIRTKEYTGYFNKQHQHVFKELIAIFSISVNGKVVKQKIKSRTDKEKEAQTGDTKVLKLFGQDKFSPTKLLPCIICEGEWDSPSAWQMVGLPAVSITRGALGSEKELMQNMEWLSGWKELLFCFDNDEKGKEAVEKYIGMFEPGFVRNMTLPLKDANDMLKAGRIAEFKHAVATAERIKPSTIVFPSELREAILRKPKYGSECPWKFMTKVTYGFRLGEVYMIAGDTSVGKSEVVYTIVEKQIDNGCKVGLLDLERQNEQTMQRLIGKKLNKKIYLPSCEDFNKEEICKELDNIDDRIALYRPESGKLSLESVLINIRYLMRAYGITFFVLDNLTALSTNMSYGVKEHEFASHATGQFVQIAKELNVTIIIINHLVKDPVKLNADITMPDEFEYQTNKEGLSWETGRMPEIGHIYGGGKVCKLVDYVIVLSRNRMSSDDKVQRTINFKFLKTRFDSTYEGMVYQAIYDREDGNLHEVYDSRSY